MVWSRSRLSFSAIMAVFLIPIIVGVASSQGLPQSPYSAPSVVRGADSTLLHPIHWACRALWGLGVPTQSFSRLNYSREFFHRSPIYRSGTCTALARPSIRVGSVRFPATHKPEHEFRCFW